MLTPLSSLMPVEELGKMWSVMILISLASLQQKGNIYGENVGG